MLDKNEKQFILEVLKQLSWRTDQAELNIIANKIYQKLQDELKKESDNKEIKDKSQ